MTGARPDVTVAIPAHNAARTIGRTLHSVLAQADEGLEVIVVDDGSTDQTAEVVRATGGERVRLLRARGGSVSAARNLALKEAKADWVALLDADDYWLDGHLMALRATLMRTPDAVVCFGAALHVDEDGALIRRFDVNEGSATMAGLLRRRMQPTTSATAVRRETALAVGGFDEHFRVVGVEDIDLWWRLAARGRCVVQPQHLTAYVVHEERDQAREMSCLLDLRADRERCIARLQGHVDDSLLRVASAQHHAILARYWLVAGLREEGRRDAVRALRYAVTPAGLAALGLSYFPAQIGHHIRRARRSLLRRASWL